MKKLWMTALLLTMILAACGSTGKQKTETTDQPSSTTAAPADVLEGTVSFYTSQPEEDAIQLITAFNELYPDIDVKLFRSGTEEVVGKVLAENTAGDVQADVLLLSDHVTFEKLKSLSLLEGYESKELANIPDKFVDADHTYTGTKVMATVIGYHTGNVSEAPTSWSILEEKSKETIMPSPLYSGAAAYNLGIFTRQSNFGWDYYTALKTNGVTVVQGNGAALKGLQAGENNYAMIVDYLVNNAAKEGSPVAIAYPTEGVPVITEPIGLVKDAKDPEAAQAFIDFVLSKEGQNLAAQQGYAPIRTDVKAPEGLKSVEELTVLSSDVKELLSNREEDKNKFKTMFGE
ncbi:extracellular solute-binding protein [Lysinibacillus sphaericus]|uniref:Extracellular solute-binding protein n=1 Tax=Lysinibacillus sphaericus TaxID=1421 RepID=A0A544V0H8_LYSSH|nr:ABC transporter substrate-binding protein [Lysinibacillus sp. SDF0037]TQR39595.1 extracellular solute-binding protein [Lysinibacillus sp. SDF0037]